MGIPAAFRWLSNKYPKIISQVVEERPLVMDDGTIIPVDITKPNPNGEELDNLYLDMNGIVHPCSHPEDKPAPKDEEEMMLEVFKYTDRVVNMVRPRKLLMIAVDGVAPRAKMNQQRSRRFRSAREAKEKEAAEQLLKSQNPGDFTPGNSEEVVRKAFDSNSITPGTPFMDILAVSLRYWCQFKLNTDPAWGKLKVIISDATVPGEGEHKIMSFIRSQRASPHYNANIRHVIYGLDADLIMLGLATHEPHFRVLREDVFFQEGRARTCKICGQKGHEARNCRGDAKPIDVATDAGKQNTVEILKPFIWLHVSVLREYLAAELAVPDLPFTFDLERAIDDWVFMCCFVGNDFLPHLPALEIREHGIDTLTTIWRDNLASMGGYVSKDGHIDLGRAQRILDGLSQQEDAIFKKRKEQEERREASAKRRKRYDANPSQVPSGGRRLNPQHGYLDPTKGLALHPIASYSNESSHSLTYDSVVSRSTTRDDTIANKTAAVVMKDRLREKLPVMPHDQSVASSHGKRKATALEDPVGKLPVPSKLTQKPGPLEEGTVDTVRLWEDGYADRYYQQKFHKDPQDLQFRHEVAQAYVEGLAWVLLYYFQGCPSWEWYYPYHYAPFAADFKELPKMKIEFEKGQISKPFEQLMSVLPAASRHALPEVFHDLMTEQNSEIADFYPEEFEIDLNGKKMAWQGVALLPFIDMPRLLKAVKSKYPLLSPKDAARNTIGKDVLLLAETNGSLYNEILTNLYSKKRGASGLNLNPETSDGLTGYVEREESYIPHGALHYPMERHTMPDLEYDRSISLYFCMPQTSQVHKSMLLRGVRMPTPVLTRSEIEVIRGKANRTSTSYLRTPLGQAGVAYPDQRRLIQYGPRQVGGIYNGSKMSQGGHPTTFTSFNTPSQISWQPPPPGTPGFGLGQPPPPPMQHEELPSSNSWREFAGPLDRNSRVGVRRPYESHWQAGRQL